MLVVPQPKVKLSKVEQSKVKMEIDFEDIVKYLINIA